jgi:hypothetical protein
LLSPDKVLSNVVFPAPFEPIIAASWPVGTARETLSTAQMAPWCTVKLETLSDI